MTHAEQLLLGVVLAVGLPSATRNLTAAALVASYMATAGIYEWFRISFDPLAYFLIDATVITAIYCKAPERFVPYETLRQQIAAAWWERSKWDRIVIACYPLAWTAYFFGDWSRWWSLWAIALVQYLAAGAEALQTFLSTRSAKTGDARPEISGMEFTRWRRVGGYG